MRGPMRRTARRMTRAARTTDQQTRHGNASARRGRKDRDARLSAYYATFEEFGRRFVLVGVVIAVAVLALVLAGGCLNRASGGRVTRYAEPAHAGGVSALPSTGGTGAHTHAPADTATPTPANTPTRYTFTTDADELSTDTPIPEPTPTARRVSVASSTAQAPPARVNPDGSITIGGDTVPPGTRCYEDEVIYFTNWISGEYGAPAYGAPVGCVHYEYIVMDFILECLIANTDSGTNNATRHAADAAYQSWCSAVVDDASDGALSLGDLLVDTAAR